MKTKRTAENAMKGISREELYAKPVKMGKRKISMRVQLFASIARMALDSGMANNWNDAGSIEGALDTGLAFLKEFTRCWETGDAEFFRELARCIEHKATDLTPRQIWLRRRLFKDDRDPCRQTEFLTGSEIKEEWDRGPGLKDSDCSYDVRRVDTDMQKIGAVFKNSQKKIISR